MPWNSFLEEKNWLRNCCGVQRYVWPFKSLMAALLTSIEMVQRAVVCIVLVPSIDSYQAWTKLAESTLSVNQAILIVVQCWDVGGRWEMWCVPYHWPKIKMCQIDFYGPTWVLPHFKLQVPLWCKANSLIALIAFHYDHIFEQKCSLL